MSDKATFDPAQNAQNAATLLDKELHQIAKPGDDASTAAHNTLLALQSDSIPTALQAQVHADLLKMDPQADALLKQAFGDFQLTNVGNDSVMRVQDTPNSDAGTQAMLEASRDIAGDLFSTNKVSAKDQTILKEYAENSMHGQAADAVNNELGNLGVTNEQLVDNQKGASILDSILAAEGTGQFVGHKGEYDVADANGKKVETVGKYTEQYPAMGSTLLNMQNGSFSPLPGGGQVTIQEGSNDQ